MINKLYDLVKGDWTVGLGMIQEVNGHDGSLSQFEYINMEDFDEYMDHLPAIDLAYKIHYGDFNPCDDYFSLNAYENLVSYSEYEIEAEIIEFRYEIVDRFVELYKEGYVDVWNSEIEDILVEMEDINRLYEQLDMGEDLV